MTEEPVKNVSDMNEKDIRQESFSKALISLDKLLPLFPELSHFTTDEVLYGSGWSRMDIEEADKLVVMIDNLLKKLKYVTENGYWLELTEKGRAAKKAGGHFAYEKQQTEKSIADAERQRRKDRSDALDLKLKTWQVKTKYLPYMVSIAALAVSFFSYFKPEKKQVDLRLMQQQIKELQQHVLKQDSLFEWYNLPKKEKK